MLNKVELHIPSPISKVVLPISKAQILLKRDDLIHSEVCGNKWRKLEGFIEDFNRSNYCSIITCGGAFSNHLHATSAFCYHSGIKNFAIIHEHAPMNYMLEDLRKWKTELIRVSHKFFRQLQSDLIIQKQLSEKYNAYFIPEGGNGKFAEKGVKRLAAELEDNPKSILITAVGTGTTLAYLEKHSSKSIIGVTLFRDGGIKENIQNLIGESKSFKLVYNDKLNRYGKINQKIIDYISEFEALNQVPLDPIYTVKMMHYVDNAINLGELKASDIICYHSGGLQARRSLNLG